MEIYEDDNPPSNLDIITRCISAFSLVFQQTRRLAYGVDYLRIIRGSGIRRRNFNLQNI